MSELRIPRRAVLLSLGLAAGALALGIPRVACSAPPVKPTWPLLPSGGFAPSALLHVAGDGTVTFVCARSEMGQGIRSSLAALVADEMGADLERVRVLQADGDAAFGDQDTDGSSSLRGDAMTGFRKLGATARTMLVAAAARQWSVPASECDARGHAVVHGKTGRTKAFGELTADAAAIPVPKDADVVLRPSANVRRKSSRQVDARDVVTGKAVFGADVRLPGMLTAVVARPPVVGGKVARYDATKTTQVPGVRQVVELHAPSAPFKFQPLGGVAVLADTTWAAMRGRAALHVEWDDGPNATYESSAYRDALLAAVRAPGDRVRSVGDAKQALASAAKTVVAEYTVPHLAHAPMEPPVSVATVTKDGCEIWSPTQAPQDVRSEVAGALGMDPSRVRVHVTLLGGAFGRKAKPDYDVEAALLSRAAGVPVRVQWSRTDDLRHGYFHTTCAQRFEAGLDAAGKPVAWLHRVAFPSISSTFKNGVDRGSDGELAQGILDLPLAVPNVLVENGPATAHVRIGWLRSVSNINHGFGLGSFVDELAHVRGVDRGKARNAGRSVSGASSARTASTVAACARSFPAFSRVDRRSCDVSILCQANASGRGTFTGTIPSRPTTTPSRGSASR